MNPQKLIPGILLLATTLLFLAGCGLKTEAPGENDNPYNDIISRAEYEFNLVKDPATGRIPEGIRQAEKELALRLPSREQFISSHSNSPLASNVYTAVGPDNLGGRTRALAYDSRYNGTTNRVMIAGSVSSGVFRTADGGASWTRVNGTANIHNITCIAQDNSTGGNPDTWYMGTGEALGNTASAPNAFYLGNGVYKSTDNGLNWTRLANSNTGAWETFDRVEDVMSKIAINPTNGNIYVARLGGVMRSTDGGATWGTVISGFTGSTNEINDVVINTAGVVFVSFSGTAGAPGGMAGIWKSTTGNSGTFTRIASPGVPAAWPADGTYGRIVMAIAPSAQNTLYALLENPAATPTGHSLYMYDNGTGVWTNRSANLPDEPGGDLAGNDPFDSQGGYDLVISVKPNDPNFVVIGGTNIYRSTDGWATTTNYKRIGGYATNLSYALYANHHPDIHAFAWQPNATNIMASGDDGGIQIADVTTATVSWTGLNNNYQTYQYYYVAIDPTAASTKYIGGAQDNGTTYRNAGTNSFALVYGGDGVSVGISAGNAFHYCGTQNGDIRRRLPGDPQNVGTNIKPTGAGTGLFVTLFHLYEENTEDLVYASNNTLYRTAAASTVTAGGWTQLTGVGTAVGGANQIMSLATTRGSYTTTHCLYIGTSNAKIYRLTDPRNVAAATAPTDITPAGITAGSTVIGIAVAPGNPDIAMAVISNYAAVSVFWTGNARAATPIWRNVEGTGPNKLDLPSFRSVEIVSRLVAGNPFHEYYVGTSAGLFSTIAIDGTSQATADATSWSREGSGVIDQAVVTSMVVRPGDNTLLVGTHGNGMFTTVIATPLPVTLTRFDASIVADHVKLGWISEVELNCKEYQVERKYKSDADFTFVTKVPATGRQSYAVDDHQVSFNSGTIFYRLKMLDNDGRSAYSKIVSLQPPTKDFIAGIYPTLVKDRLTIDIGRASNSEKMLIAIFSNDGRKVFSESYDYSKTIISLGHLPPGIYYLKATGEGGEKFSGKFVKQ